MRALGDRAGAGPRSFRYIEIVNPGHDGGAPSFPDLQIEATIALARDICVRWAIAPERVLAHSDISRSAIRAMTAARRRFLTYRSRRRSRLRGTYACAGRSRRSGSSLIPISRDRQSGP